MKKGNGKHIFNFALSGAIGILLCLSVFLIAILGLPSNMHDELPQNFENFSLDNVVSELNHKNNSKRNIELIFGDKSYSLNENPSERLKAITSEVYIEPKDANVLFNPDGDEVFVFQDEVMGQEVDVNNLALYIKENLRNNRESRIVIPTTALAPNITKKDLEGLVKVRGEFSTSIVGSQEGRRHNVAYALKAFNGLIVMPDEEVSFNKITGDRTFSNEYKDATIISGGEFVQGRGGGVCQASTTLYNALIRADVEVMKVNNHSLPVKYVPLAFDAMVNDSTSDLVFKNTTGNTLYFMTGSDDEHVWVKIFGAPLEEGLTIETKSEIIRDIKKGDKIVADTENKYADKITYKGEYYRVKYPQNGKECKGYLLYYKNGELIDQKEVRHVYYQGQEGIIMEGTEELYEGMTLPTNTVEFITNT